MAKKVKLPTDVNQKAKSIVDLVTNEDQEETYLNFDGNGKNAAAVALGRLGGKKGGAARAKALTAKQRKEIAQKAAAARWHKK